MRGLLSFMILWLLAKKDMYGGEIAEELKSIRGEKPNPGTLYPALKDLEKKNLVTSEMNGHTKTYRITENGLAGFEVARTYFCKCFDDLFHEWDQNRSKRKSNKKLKHH